MICHERLYATRLILPDDQLRGVGSVHRSAGARRCFGPLVGRREALARSVSRSALARSVSQSVQSRGSVHQSVGNVRLRIYRSLDGRHTRIVGSQ